MDKNNANERNEQNIKELLLMEDSDFKMLNIKHQEYDQRLKELNEMDFKTEDLLIEERNLKKEKLRIKDSMERYIFDYKKNMYM